MNNIIATTILLNSIFITSGIAQQQQFPYLRNIQIHAGISYSKDEQMFYYTYTLFNDISNTGNIADLAIDISTYPNALDIDTIGLQFENDGFTEGSFRRHYPSLKGKIIPVGFLSSPLSKWTGQLSNHLTASFNSPYECPSPGNIISGFELMSKGLPTIRHCVISPDFDFDSLFSEERFPDEEVLSPHFTDSVQNAGKYHGFTIGPTAPPMNFSAITWCDTLISFTTQSRTLCWIKDQTTVDKYLSYFVSTKTKFVQQDSIGARTVLVQVLKNVDIDSISTLTSEAYALLKFNTEYLIKQLFDLPTK